MVKDALHLFTQSWTKGAGIHGHQRCTAPLMDLGVGGWEQTTLAAEALVPSLFVEMDVLGVDVFKEARVPDVELVRRDTNNGP